MYYILKYTIAYNTSSCSLALDLYFRLLDGKISWLTAPTILVSDLKYMLHTTRRLFLNNYNVGDDYHSLLCLFSVTALSNHPTLSLCIQMYIFRQYL